MVSVSGLKEEELYEFKIAFVPTDGSKYKFINLKWQAVSESEIRQQKEKLQKTHRDGMKTGKYWMEKPISFKNVKISHYDSSKNDNVSILGKVRMMYSLQ